MPRILRLHASSDERLLLSFAGQSLFQLFGLLALSGGQPLTVHGEWDGSRLRPLTAVSPEGFWIWTPRA